MNTGINRIRLEFKADNGAGNTFKRFVLIESDWNLKTYRIVVFSGDQSVLIESDWNLKDADSLRGIGAILY